MNYKFGIDVDGVLADFESSFRLAANKIFPDRLPEGYRPDNWDYTDKFTKEEFKAAWVEVNSTPDFYFYEQPMRENVRSLKYFLTEHKCEVYYITSRRDTAGDSIMRQTEMWLDAQGLLVRRGGACIIPVPNTSAKREVLSALKIPYMLDDYHVTVDSLQSLETTKTFLLDAPWNQHAQHLPRLYSVAEYLTELSKSGV